MFILHYHVQRVEVTRAGGGCSLGLTIPGTISNFNISRGPGLTRRTLLPCHLTILPAQQLTLYMTGLLHEGIFHVRGLCEPAIFDSLPWAYVMCNWAQILVHRRH